jgi:hypothetical protein
MVILIAYELWLERSRIIFEGKVRPVRDIVGVDMVVFAPVPQKTRPLAPHGSSWRFGSTFFVLSSVWVSLCVWRVCVVTSRVSPCRLMVSLIQSRAHFEPYV